MLMPYSAAVPTMSGSAHTLARLNSRPSTRITPSVQRTPSPTGASASTVPRTVRKIASVIAATSTSAYGVPSKYPRLMRRVASKFVTRGPGHVAPAAGQHLNEGPVARLLPDVDGRVDAKEIAAAPAYIPSAKLGRDVSRAHRLRIEALLKERHSIPEVLTHVALQPLE